MGLVTGLPLIGSCGPAFAPTAGRAVKMRCDSWTSQPAELNVIRELIGFSIQCTRQWCPYQALSLGGTSAEAFRSAFS